MLDRQADLNCHYRIAAEHGITGVQDVNTPALNVLLSRCFMLCFLGMRLSYRRGHPNAAGYTKPSALRNCRGRDKRAM